MRPLPALTMATLLSGCAYDWAIGPIADAGAGGSGTSSTATTSHTTTSSSAGSTTSSSSASSSSSSASSSTGAMPDCAMLLASLDTARNQAKSCTLGMAGQCTTSIVDECHCNSHVTQGGSAAANAFATAVQKFGAAGCTPSCTTCLPSAGACLLENGMGPYCLP